MQVPENTGRTHSSSDNPSGRAPESRSPGGVVNQPISSPITSQPLDARIISPQSIRRGVISTPRSSSEVGRVPAGVNIAGQPSVWGEIKMDVGGGDEMEERIGGGDLSPSRSTGRMTPPDPPHPPHPLDPQAQFAPPEEQYIRANWVNFQSAICYGFGKLYETKDLADVTIACDGSLIKCHKLVLGLSSCYFRRMFDSVRCKHPVVILSGVRLKDIKNVLRFIYYGHFHGTQEDIKNFRSTAECLQIDGVYSDIPRETDESKDEIENSISSQRIVIEESPLEPSAERPHEVDDDDDDHFHPPSNLRRDSAQFPVFPPRRNSSRPSAGSTSAQSPPDFRNRRKRSTHYSPDNPRFDDSPPGVRRTVCEDSSSQSQEYGESSVQIRRSVILQSPSSGEGSRSRGSILEENLPVGSLTVHTDPTISSSSHTTHIYIRRQDGEISVIPANQFSHISPSGSLPGPGAPDLSPASDLRMSGPTRPPVVVPNRRRATSDSVDDNNDRYGFRTNPFTIPRGQRSPPNFPSSTSRGPTSHLRGPQSSWDPNSPFTATSETVTSPDARHQLAMLQLEHAQRSSSLPHTFSGAGSQPRFPHRKGPMEQIPLHLINPGLMASRLSSSAAQGSRGPSPSRMPLSSPTNRTNPGVIAIVPTMRRPEHAPPPAHSQDLSQSDLNAPSNSNIFNPLRGQVSGFYQQGHPSSLALAHRAPYGSPGFIGHHSPRQVFPIPLTSGTARQQPFIHSVDDQQLGYSRSQIRRQSLPQVDNPQPGSSSQSIIRRQSIHSADEQQPGPSRRQNRHQTRSGARPKTKAIRSSQVPQSARYTAQEVDIMVDQVANHPGNTVPCAVCQKLVKRERLRAHIHECHLLHGKRIICPRCGIGLKSKGSFRVHIWRHKRGSLPGTKQNGRCKAQAAAGSQQQLTEQQQQEQRHLEELAMQQAMQGYDPAIDVVDDSDMDEAEWNGEEDNDDVED